MVDFSSMTDAQLLELKAQRDNARPEKSFENMTDDELLKLKAERDASSPTVAANGLEPRNDTYPMQTMSGANEGLANLLGSPVDIVNAGIQGGAALSNKFLGTDIQPSEKPFLGSEMIKDTMGMAIAPPSQDRGKRFARRVGQEVGAGAPFLGTIGKAAQPLKQGAGLVASLVGSGTGAAIAQDQLPDSPTAELIGQVLGGAIPLAAQTIPAYLARKKQFAHIPSVKKIERVAGKLYDLADRNGVIASMDDVEGVARKMDALLDNEGLIVKVATRNKKGVMQPPVFGGDYPKVKHAWQQLRHFGKRDMNVPRMKTMRGLINDVVMSKDKKEQRLGAMMMEIFDEFTSPLAPELHEANALWHRARKADTLEQLDTLADATMSTYTNAGRENAVRQQYKALDKKIIKGTERGWTPAEQAAIHQVNVGTPAANRLRSFGKHAPTGPVPLIASGGVPFMIGNAVGGPALGATLGGATMASGTAARTGSRMATEQSAKMAELLVRAGVPLQKGARLTPELIDLAKKLMAAQIANQMPEAQK
ncbi:MAG: hypothetical protein GY761_03215 [Hyphomicrobiales bacterium]|nr:hypothetical protein [Hyphomicrobiales bacterium]